MITDFIKEVKNFFKEVHETNFSELSLDELKNFNNKMAQFYSNSIVCKNETDEDKIYSTIVEGILNCYSQFVRKTEYANICMKFINDVIATLPEGFENVKKVAFDFFSDVSTDVTDIIKSYTEIDNSERKIILESNLDSYNYLYYYGTNITKNQLQLVDFFNNIDDATLTDMAKCTVDSFLRGLEKNGIDVEKKKYFILIYPIGFEKVAKKIYYLLAGKLEIIFSADIIEFNEQVSYNHRYDYNLYMNKKYVTEFLSTFEKALKTVSYQLSSCAGTVYIELFGENCFDLKNGSEIYPKSAELSKIHSDFDTMSSNLFWKYFGKDTSFCMISYPCPEIGDDFEEIFKETIHINTLDNSMYEKIHQSIIDVLDTASFVHVTGKNGNKTDLTVVLSEISNPEKETIFQNCCADVNVPVGEVFTTPKLTGTNGILHVSEIYLNGCRFKDLILEIQNGFIEHYSCTNYPTESENTEYLNEYLLFDHSTLPMSEFAIGTNTYAYVMGNKYNISDKLGVLISEKTGPHFAFGDTCYSQEEDNEIFNPDGKEIVAKDNDVSIKRLSDNSEIQDEAYFGCHTDITIPYYELGDIIAIQKDGTEIPIMLSGKFVLSGTEKLNIDGM